MNALQNAPDLTAAARKSLNNLPDVLTPGDLLDVLPIGRNALYEALRSQRIRNVRYGQKYLICKGAVREFLGATGNDPRAGTPLERN